MRLSSLQLGRLGQQRLSSNSRVVLSAQTRPLAYSLQDSQHVQEHCSKGFWQQPNRGCQRMHAKSRTLILPALLLQQVPQQQQ